MLSFNNITNFFVISLAYQKANTGIRGKFSFDAHLINKFCNEIYSLDNYNKLFILSTCNRTEIYIQTEDIEKIISIYCKNINVSLEEFYSYISIYNGKNAITHFLRVAAGLESQIIGDFEIISQIKKAFKAFKKQKVTNAFLERLVNTGIQISKKIKSTTALSNGATSMSYAAVHYLLNNINDISNKKIALVGTGKIGKNTCENLLKHLDNPNNITLLNRTRSKAENLANLFNLKVKDYDNLHSEINNSDVVIVATGSPETIFNEQDLNNNSKPITFLDLSIPINICPSLKEHSHVTLLNVDDLSKIINHTFKQRNKEIPKAELIIQEIMEEFIIWTKNRKYAPIIHAFKSDLERIKEYQKKSLEKDQIKFTDSENELSDRLVQKITNRLAGYLVNNPEKAEKAIDLFKEMFKLQVSK